MPLSNGTRLGPYEIVAAIGAGGMGEVYRARDTRLDRVVAIKVLAASCAHDPDSLRRFEQEARAIAVLAHPNIVSVYDVGSHEGSPYLVTEFLEGDTLRQRLREGVIPQRKAVEYAVEIARGLAAAHDRGIVHRDLKPENVFLTRDEQVKLLDFGLAKLARAERAAAAADGITVSQTSPGLVVGTVGYMSPEQVRAQTLDHRSDIFSFGAVLHEMLSGKPAFLGDSAVETMNAILKQEPPELTAPGLPLSPALERITRRCLEKRPEERFQSARDLAFALEALPASSSASTPAAQVPSTAGHRRLRVALLAAAVVMIAAAAFLAGWHQRQARTTVPSFGQLTFARGYIRAARFAPDGRTVIYGAEWNQKPMLLYSVRTDGLESRLLEIPPADILAISRNGEMAIALDRDFADNWMPTGRLARVHVAGGAPRELLDNVTDADWSPDGNQLAVARPVAGRFRLEYPIGKVLYETSGYISHLRFSPQGDVIAFLDHPIQGDDRGTVAIVDLTGKKTTLTQEWWGEQGLAWSPDGREIWFTAGAQGGDKSLRAVDRRGNLHTLLASPVRLMLHDVAPDGRALLSREYLRGEVYTGKISGPARELSKLDFVVGRAISRDGKLLVINSYGQGSGINYTIFLAKTDGSPAVQLGPGIAGGISSDGKWVASLLPTDDSKLLLVPTGVGETQTVTAPNFHYREGNWLADGRLLFRGFVGGGAERMWVQAITGGPPRPVTPEGVVTGVISTDSTHIVARDDSGAARIYPLFGGEPAVIPGVGPRDEIIAAGTDFVYVSSPAQVPRQVYRVDLKSGRRTLFTSVGPADPAGVLSIRRFLLAADQTRYAYSIYRIHSALFVADGLK